MKIYDRSLLETIYIEYALTADFVPPLLGLSSKILKPPEDVILVLANIL